MCTVPSTFQKKSPKGIDSEDSGDSEFNTEPVTSKLDGAIQSKNILDFSNAEEMMKGIPQLRTLFNQWMDERVQKEKKSTVNQGESSRSELISTTQPKSLNESSKSVQKGSTPTKGIVKGVSLIKSPSDTTIYIPALRKLFQPRLVIPKESNQNDFNTIGDMHVSSQSEVEDVTNHVSNFVEQIHQTQFKENSSQDKEQITPKVKSAIVVKDPEEELTRKEADQAVLEMEKFKATVSQPPGTSHNLLLDNTNIDPTMKLLQELVNSLGIQPDGLSDDDFFHLTCHIDENLRGKIAKGEFVDLDRLLPKDRFAPDQLSDHTRMEWVQNAEGTFLVPAKKVSRINCFRKWEQAFRIYATIYCEFNPGRAKEIWQYISVINTASSSFQWENVHNYNVTFRQLMAFNPKRSWAITYNQM